MPHALDYPDHDAVLGSISNVEDATAKLRAFADGYIDLRQKNGPEDPMAAEAAKLMLPWVDAIERSQIELAQHMPKMLAAGDQATYWVERSLSVNDAAATYTRDLKENLCPELFGSGAAIKSGMGALNSSAGLPPSNSAKSAEEREKGDAMVDIEMMSEGDADEVRCPPTYSPPLTVALS